MSRDGVDHINVYSKGETWLGRALSNFSESRIQTEDGPFSSIEGYWYWLGCKDDRLRSAVGYRAKLLGRELGAPDWQTEATFRDKICRAITIKIQSSPKLLQEFNLSTLPFRHYYVYSSKVIEPREGKWIIEHLTSLRGEQP